MLNLSHDGKELDSFVSWPFSLTVLLLCQAAEFRQLWGARSELRRFQDGAITEAVVWAGESTCQKQLIPKQIITHLLQM